MLIVLFCQVVVRNWSLSHAMQLQNVQHIMIMYCKQVSSCDIEIIRNACFKWRILISLSFDCEYVIFHKTIICFIIFVPRANDDISCFTEPRRCGRWLVRCYAGPQLFLFQTAGCMLYWGKNRERFANHEINYFAVMLWIINYRLYRGPWCWAGVVLTVLYELTNCLILFIFFFSSCMIIFVVFGNFSIMMSSVLLPGGQSMEEVSGWVQCSCAQLCVRGSGSSEHRPFYYSSPRARVHSCGLELDCIILLTYPEPRCPAPVQDMDRGMLLHRDWFVCLIFTRVCPRVQRLAAKNMDSPHCAWRPAILKLR